MKDRIWSFCLLLLVACVVPARAQSATIDVVYLVNGSIIRGTIVELIPNKSLRIRTSDGSEFVYEMRDVTKIEKLSVSPGTSYAAGNTYRHNPYTIHKRIGALGLASVLSATLVGSLAMGDEYFATTVRPIVGPWVTMVRIENTPFGGFLPGGKPLLITSGILQASFLTYFVSSWVKEDTYNRRLAVVPAPNMQGVLLTYRF
ncbi:MAG: hypothetical protein R2834_20390 [Rhodothermales bacterium]